MFLHPRQARAALASVDGVDRFRFVVDRSDEQDVLRCEVLAAADAELDELVESVRQRIRSALRFGAEVEIVDAIDGDGLIVDRRSWNPNARARAAGG
jgi:phenylacetate-CoA ligase